MKLSDLIRAWFVNLIQKGPFKAYAANILASVPPFDPDATQDELTAQQISWLEEVYADSQT